MDKLTPNTMAGGSKKSPPKEVLSPVNKCLGTKMKSPKKSKRSIFGVLRRGDKENSENVPPPDVLAPSPRVIKEGWLQKRGEHIKNWRSRYFVLREDGSLQGFKGRQDNDKPQQPLNNFTVRGCAIMMISRPKPFSFLMRGLHHKSVVERMFHVKTSNEREEWVSAIKSVAESLKTEDDKKKLEELSQCTDFDQLMIRDVEPRKLGSLPDGASSSCEDLTAKFKQQKISETSSGNSKVTLEKFEFIKVLGRGTFGKVILCREKSTSKLYAIKVLKKNVIIETNEVDHTLAERRVLGKTRHPFIISLKCSFQTEHNLCHVMEFANGGDLFYHLKNARFFTEERSRYYGAEIVDAIDYLHKFGVIYRDLKLENLLLDKDGHIKLADFGLCKEDIAYGETTHTFCGTPEYIAPEIIEDKDYGFAVDWWGVGIIIYEMLCGQLPFYSHNHEELFVQILANELAFPPTLSPNAIDLLKGLLEKDPGRRLGGSKEDAKEVKAHPFFLSINWQDLHDKKIPTPFQPEVESATDTRYFDSEFTGESVELTPPKESRCRGAAGGTEASVAARLDDIFEEDDDETFNDFGYQDTDCEFSNSTKQSS